MSSLITNATIQIRKDTAGNWTSNNPTPAAGEWCLETDTTGVKIGDGSTAWTSLAYSTWPASRFRATTATPQAMADGAFTKVVFGTEVYDNLSEYAIATGVFTATYPGYYQVNAMVTSAATAWDATETWISAIYKNGASYNRGFRYTADAAETITATSNVSDQVYLTAGQYIDIRVYHNQGAEVNTLNNAVYNYFAVHRLS